MTTEVELAAKLFNTGSLLGKQVSAGRYTPATPSPFTWCVLNLQGSPLVLCHDAITALCWWQHFEKRGTKMTIAGGQHGPLRIPTDDKLEEWDFADRSGRMRWGEWIPI